MRFLLTREQNAEERRNYDKCGIQSEEIFCKFIFIEQICFGAFPLHETIMLHYERVYFVQLSTEI